MKVALYTAIYGRYDNLRLPVKQNYPVDFFYFHEGSVDIYDLSPKDSPNPILKSKHPPYDPWNDHPDRDLDPVNIPIMSSVLIRCSPSKPPLLLGYDLVVYLDGNVFISSPNFVEEFFVAPLQANPEVDIVLSNHPWRDCLYEEADVSAQIPKYRNTDFERLVSSYHERGVARHSGLYWNGLIGFNMRRNLDRFFELYTNEMFDYIIDPSQPFHPQGQVVLPYCIKEAKAKLYLHPQLYTILAVSGHNR